MGNINLSLTAQKILAIFFSNPDRKFYVNELIRETGKYPNSVQQALKSLEKQEILLPSRRGRFKPYRLNRGYQFLQEIERMLGNKMAKEITKQEKYDWVKILNREASYAFTMSVCLSNMNQLKKNYGVSAPTFWNNGITMGVYYNREELTKLGRAISDKIEKNIKFAAKDITLCYDTCDCLVKLAKTFSKKDLPHKRNRELARLLKDFSEYYLAVFPFLTAPHAIERYFETQIREKVPDENILKKLLSPVLTSEEERNSALKVAAYVKEYGFNKQYEQLLNKHWQDYCWLSLWTIEAKPLEISYFEEEIKNIIQVVKNPVKEIRRAKEEEKLRKKELQIILKRIKASKILKDQVNFLQEYIYLRTYRKNAICEAHFYHLPLIYEAARRLNLTEEVRFLSYKEIIECLLKIKLAGKFQKLARERQKGWAILMWKGRIKTITGVRNIIETVERYRIVAPGPQKIKVVKGNPACRGNATGRVKIVRKLSELNKVERGNVLVAKMTTPDYMMAIHKAAAIVTDEGGVTCHAAIVSREFNIPCIVGTKNATQILSDNDMVEVDADKGIVRVVEAVEVDEDVKVIFGKTTYEGKVRGLARIILDASDFPKIREGDILVAPQTTPEYLSSLYRVKGFIVDEESVTSHAMLYAKALKLPAIMGTQFARNVLQDGEKIELDATNGVIKRLEK